MANDELAGEIAAQSPAADEEADSPLNDSEPSLGLPSTEEEEDASGRFRHVPLLLAILLPALLFFIAPPLTRSGLWDPFELNVADFARRIAINLHGASNLVLEGADNSLPHLNDLGRPQLAFTSIALGFRYLGLSEWAGRAPLALWGLLGVVATYGSIARLVDKRAGLYSAVALSTMPLYFVQARTMLGDIVGMSAFAMAVGGLLVAFLDRADDGSRSVPARLPWLALGLLGLLAGYYSRGGMIGVGVPLLIVGAVRVMLVGSGEGSGDVFAGVLGSLSLIGGLFVTWAFLNSLGKTPVSTDLNPWVGVMLKTPSRYPTFDFVIGQLGPALAPWSAFIPFAMGRLFIPPMTSVAARADRESATKMALLFGAAITLVTHGWLDANAEPTSFVGVSLLAAACGIALRDYEKGAHPSLALAVGTAALLGLFHHDFHNLPEKAFQAFAVAPPTFPESYKETSLAIWTVVLIGLAGLTILTWAENTSPRKPFDPERYSAIIDSLQKAWDGLLALGFLATVAGASMAGLGLWIGVRTHSSWVPNFSQQARGWIMNAWWIAAVVPLAVIFVVYFWLDIWLWAFGAEGKNRANVESPKGSLLRGFEPLEQLAERAKQWPTLTPSERLGVGILVPLVFLQVPALVFGALYAEAGARLPIAVAFALPSGVFVFLLLGAAGTLLNRSRVAFYALGVVAAGAVLSGKYCPDLANQLSPKEVFETYQRVHKSGEPLALFGVGGRTAAYYAGTNPLTFADPVQAFAWLRGAENGARRFMAIKGDDIAKLNRMYREGFGGNLPVLDARSSQILLASSALLPSEKNENPLGKIILTSEPSPQVKLDASLEDKIQVLGYDVTDAKGRLVTTVASGKPYHLRTYFRSLSAQTSDWDMFIHIDGQKRRHNGDHKLFGGKYPCTLWVQGDVLMDDHEFKLEPNFTAGSYTIYFGLYVGETRLKVTKGPNDGADRVIGKSITVQ